MADLDFIVAGVDALGDSEVGASASRVRAHFFASWPDDSSVDDPNGWFVLAYALRHRRRTDAIRSHEAQRILDDAVFKGVIADDSETPSGAKYIDCALQSLLYVA